MQVKSHILSQVSFYELAIPKLTEQKNKSNKRQPLLSYSHPILETL